MNKRILIIDDEPSICVTLAMALGKKYATQYKLNARDGLNLLKSKDFDLVLLDLKIGMTNGLDVLKEIKAYDPAIAVIIITAFGSIDTTIEAMRAGAYTYVTKPLRIEELQLHIEQALRVAELEEKVTHLRTEIEHQYNYYGMIGKSEGMKRVFSLIDKVKDSNVSVLISGESGSGKELVARAIHYSGPRRGKNFVAVNCAAIPETLLEDEMFGHVKGSFTGAIATKKGRFEQADGGTLFLDEIGDMPLAMQAKLLRVLQEKRYTPLGSEEEREVDVRVIAATNRDIRQMIGEGTFRQDLFYRLNVVGIPIPPLRERQDDIHSLCDYFLGKFSREQNKPAVALSPKVEQLLMEYGFPGNVRQLANVLEYALIVCDGKEIQIADLPEELRKGEKACASAEQGEENGRIDVSGKTMKEIEKQVILARLEEFGGHQQKTANSLGISERSLRNKLNEYRQQ
ncbi:MAG: sigma-54-dependent Fis family transcriptional regulator [Oscillospiraceae bacterium]|nr:sigma-54-dependent Fis family transcriptional regulator [Oscillospiraceae bacterium]